MKMDEGLMHHIGLTKQQHERAKAMFDNPKRPEGSNADEWHLFLSRYLDNRATSPSGMTFMAVQIAEAIEDAERRGASH